MYLSSHIVTVIVCVRAHECACVCSENTYDLPSWQMLSLRYSIVTYSHL